MRVIDCDVHVEERRELAVIPSVSIAIGLRDAILTLLGKSPIPPLFL